MLSPDEGLNFGLVSVRPHDGEIRPQSSLTLGHKKNAKKKLLM